MAGRTHLQHALPITFGFKCAVWLDAVQRQQRHLAALREAVPVVQFGGAAGTLASLGADGIDVLTALAEELGLGVPRIAWHVARDRLAEVACFEGVLTGVLGKIATDVMLMMQTELDEVREPYLPGRGGSSTMPQKRNPIACELILAAARNVRQLVPVMLDALIADHERATGPWHAEWIALPQAFALTAGALHHTRALLEGLEVDPARMRRNLDATHGMISAEAVMMALAPHVGREQAHHLVAERLPQGARGGARPDRRAERRACDHGASPGGAPGGAARAGDLYRPRRRVRRPRAGGASRQQRLTHRGAARQAVDGPVSRAEPTGAHQPVKVGRSRADRRAAAPVTGRRDPAP